MGRAGEPALTLRERLRALYSGASGRRLKEWLDGGRVHVNGAVVRRGDAVVGPEDRIELRAAAPPSILALRLVHEDEHLVVVDKPSGLLTIATDRERERTAYRLLRDWGEAQGRPRIFIVHRLDRETSGLLVFARGLTGVLAAGSRPPGRPGARGPVSWAGRTAPQPASGPGLAPARRRSASRLHGPGPAAAK